MLKEVFLDPLLAHLGQVPSDPTYGRYTLPFAHEDIHIRSLADIQTRQRRVFYKALAPSATKVKGYPKSRIDGVALGDADQEWINVEEGEDVRLTPEEVNRGKGRQWVYYQVWTSNAPEAREGKGRGYDLLVIHGALIPSTFKLLRPRS